ncbi:MAG TPA: NTP transferase domain-containing protein [Bryobacteraceae bacterium]|nr:NTP transferase domain-containing protein [Bryobacteraceae bacterium]
MPDTLKAIVLAAGNPILLENMGDRSVVQCVAENALEVAAPEDTWVVVGKHSDQVRMQLGERYRYVEQDEPLGIGDAVRRALTALGNFQGDLLILYGDKPLFRATSIRGLLNRHRLRNADATLFAADGAAADMSLGAYAVRAGAVEQLLNRTSLHVESYQVYDPDEMQGINSADDLAQAELILRKRLYRPRREEEQNLIKFGTGGWRAVIGEGFTMHNVRRLCQALANEITRRGQEKCGVVVGYDRRFLSRQAGEAAAEVFAGNNIFTILLPEPAPTPLVTYATARRKSAYGLVFTASHNPPEWNGLKVFRGDGSLLLDRETRQIEAETNALPPERVIKLDLDLALAAGVVTRHDFTNEYVDAVEALIDLDAIRNAGLKLIVDPMYGVGQLTLGTVLTEARCRVTFIHERHNPLFGGRSPAPDAEALRLLSSTMRDDGYDLGLAMDGDADRIAIVDECGGYVSVNDLLLLLYWYLHEVRGDHGGIVRNLATTHLLDRLAARLGEECYEVPVGFKHVVSAMIEHNAVLGGESSGGLTIRGHILGKDGIFACALVVEMLARTGQRISQLLERVYALTGRLYQAEESLPATPEMRIAIPRRLCEARRDRIASYAVVRTSQEDGIKLYLENDNWALLRFSGTEPVLRLAVEADSPHKANELLAWLRQFVTV